MRRWMGFKNLLIDTIEHTTNLVQETHNQVMRQTLAYAKLIEPLQKPVELIEGVHTLSSDIVYHSIRFGNRAVSKLIDIGVHIALENDTSIDVSEVESTPGFEDNFMGALNGIVGDFLAKQKNTLEFAMTFRQNGQYLSLDPDNLRNVFATSEGKLCIFIHGLACTEWSWNAFAEKAYGDPTINYGKLLERDLKITPLYLRYNSGRHISKNGHELSELLEKLIDAFPCEVKEIILIGHSMGGLVARSAAYCGQQNEARWIDRLQHVFCLGSPHLGAPLEKAGNLLSVILNASNTPATKVLAKILNTRSAGIKDLRFGSLVDEEWLDKNPDTLRKTPRKKIPFVSHAAYYFIAASVTKNPSHPLGMLIGDLMVRLPSAMDKIRHQPFTFKHGMVVGETSHLQLVNHPDVYTQIRRWCDSEEKVFCEKGQKPPE